MFYQLKECRQLLQRIWQQSTLKEKTYLIFSFSFLILGKAGTVSAPIVFKECIDYLNNPSIQDLKYPLILVLTYVGIGILGILLSELREFFFTIVSQNFIAHISHQAFDHLQKLPLAFHEQKKKGSLARALDRGIISIEQILKHLIYGILPSLCEIILILGIIVSFTHYTYSFIFLSGLSLYVFYTRLMIHWRTSLLRRVNDCEDLVSDQAMDSMLNVDIVKAFANEDRELLKYDAALSNYKKEAINCQKSLFFMNAGQQFILSLTLGSVLIVSLIHLFNKTLTLGTFVMLNTYALQIFNPVHHLSTVYKLIRESIIAMEKMLNIFKVQDEFCKTSSQPHTLLESAPSVDFQNVTFSYPNKGKLIQEFNLHIKAGQKIALVGYSGQGKSTIPKLLQRFYEIQSGNIQLNDIDIRHIHKRELRKNIGYIPQDVSLFNETIYYNISYGDPYASEDRIVKAAEMANIHSFIMSLPDQYQTIVGERGLKLSGGERQRIALARAFLKNAPLLILDEATSHLDNENEGHIYENIQQNFKDKTVIVIAHRLSTIKNMDQIYIMHKGQIIHFGKHDDLINTSKIYKKLWNIENT